MSPTLKSGLTTPTRSDSTNTSLRNQDNDRSGFGVLTQVPNEITDFRVTHSSLLQNYLRVAFRVRLPARQVDPPKWTRPLVQVAVSLALPIREPK